MMSYLLFPRKKAWKVNSNAQQEKKKKKNVTGVGNSIPDMYNKLVLVIHSKQSYFAS